MSEARRKFFFFFFLKKKNKWACEIDFLATQVAGFEGGFVCRRV